MLTTTVYAAVKAASAVVKRRKKEGNILVKNMRRIRARVLNTKIKRVTVRVVKILVQGKATGKSFFEISLWRRHPSSFIRPHHVYPRVHVQQNVADPKEGINYY